MEEKAPPPLRSKVMKFIKYLPGIAAFSIPSRPHSPGGNHRLPTNRTSIIPSDARRRLKNGSSMDAEPTSPKVTCTGRVKYRKVAVVCRSRSRRSSAPLRPCVVLRSLEGKGTEGGEEGKVCELKRSASRRGMLAEYDWRETVACHDDDGGKEEEEEEEEEEGGEGGGGGESDGGDGREVVVVLEPRKEVNLWKRRTVAPPKPLSL